MPTIHYPAAVAYAVCLVALFFWFDGLGAVAYLNRCRESQRRVIRRYQEHVANLERSHEIQAQTLRRVRTEQALTSQVVVCSRRTTAALTRELRKRDIQIKVLMQIETDEDLAELAKLEA